MVKAGYTKIKVNNAFEDIFEMIAAEAVHIATAIHTNSSILWTEDHNMQKESLKEIFKNHLIEVRPLSFMGKLLYDLDYAGG